MIKWHWTYCKALLRWQERNLLLQLQQGIFYMHHPTERIAHTTAVVKSAAEHWHEQETAQWVNHEESMQRPTAP